MRKFERITQAAYGQAFIRDTGISVYEVVSMVMGGASLQTTIEAFPSLETDDILEALASSISDLASFMSMAKNETYISLSTIRFIGHWLLEETTPEEREIKERSQEIVKSASHLKFMFDYLMLYGHLTCLPAEAPQFPLPLQNVVNEFRYDLPALVKVSLEIDDDLPAIHSNQHLKFLLPMFVTYWVHQHSNCETKIWIYSIQNGFVDFRINSVCSNSVDYERLHERLQWYGSPLSLISRLIRQHGGELQLHQTEEGITVEFQLPIWKDPQA